MHNRAWSYHSISGGGGGKRGYDPTMKQVSRMNRQRQQSVFYHFRNAPLALELPKNLHSLNDNTDSSYTEQAINFMQGNICKTLRSYKTMASPSGHALLVRVYSHLDIIHMYTIQ